jgi:sugar phosphate isomerase/epimerase
VRPGGRAEPREVESALPKFIEKAQKHDLTTDMIVTGIVTASDPFTERILRAASSSGIKYYRLGWLDYDKKAGIPDTLKKYKRDFSDLVKLNMKYKIHGGYQNHSGEKVGSPVWDLNELLGSFPPEYLGSQYDVRHAMVEGADSWVLGMRLISSHIKTLAIKDFTWKLTGNKPEPVSVPLGEGMVDWERYFGMIKELNIIAPLTLHIEYPLLAEGEENLSLIKQQEIIVRKLKKDADFIKYFLNKYQLI